MEMEKNRGSSMDDLKLVLLPDMITEILSRLPADSAIRCRGVCKQWRSLIDHSSFHDTHTRQLISSSSSTSNPKKFGNHLIPNASTSSSGFFLRTEKQIHDYRRRFRLEVIEYNDGGGTGEDKSKVEFKPRKPIIELPIILHRDWLNTMLMISSCNGLVFMGSTETNDMFVCNPFTREYVNLRTPSFHGQPYKKYVDIRGEYVNNRSMSLNGQNKGYMVYGFGYHLSTNEYKVVCIYYDANRKNKGKVSVYTLGSGKWRNKGEIPYLLNVTTEYPGMFANGVIHWFTYNHDIVSFDLADEEFRVVIPLLPPSPDSNDIDQYWGLGGCLCVTRSDKRSEKPKDIWVLNHVLATNHTNNKEEEKDQFSWNKKFSIPGKGINPWAATAPQVVLKSGKILLRCVDGITTYDPKNEAFVDGEYFFGGNRSIIIPYTQSFVSLKALGEEYAKCWRFDDNNNSLRKEFGSSQSSQRRRSRRRRFDDNA